MSVKTSDQRRKRKRFTGKVLVRLEPADHKAMQELAEASDKSLNQEMRAAVRAWLANAYPLRPSERQ